MPLEAYLVKFVDLLVVPFKNLGTIWGILPVYASLALGELYERKVSYGRAIINGAIMTLVGLDWAWHLSRVSKFAYIFSSMKLPWIVTACCIGVGIFTITLGVRRKDKQLAAILGHPRFSCYFLILLYPLQTRLVPWTGTAWAAILIFAVPAWLLIYVCGRLAASVFK